MPGRSPTPPAGLLPDMPETHASRAPSDRRARLPRAPRGVAAALVLAGYAGLLGLVPIATAWAAVRASTVLGPSPGAVGPVGTWLAVVVAAGASPAVAARGASAIAGRLGLNA